MTDVIWAAVPAARAWLDAANGTDDAVLDECAVKVSGRLSEHAGLGQ